MTRAFLLLSLVASTACSATSAPPEVAAAALTLAPPPGQSRIYVYRTGAALAVVVTLQVAVDSQIVGETLPGDFVMLDLQPGRHRVSAPTLETEAAVVVDALPDSAYFFKMWPKMGILIAEAGIERVDATKGAAAVRGGRMVVTTWPGKPMPAAVADTTSPKAIP